MVAGWNAVLDRDSAPAAIYVRWSQAVDDAVRVPKTPAAERQKLAETALSQAIERLTREQGADWSQWRHGRVNASELPHMMVAEFDLPPVERGGGFGAVNATGANFRRIVDLSNLDASVATNAPGQSAQPGSPFYGNLRESLGNGEYFPLPLSREAVDRNVAYRLSLQPR
jgi:penicillin G amidase